MAHDLPGLVSLLVRFQMGIVVVVENLLDLGPGLDLDSILVDDDLGPRPDSEVY